MASPLLSSPRSVSWLSLSPSSRSFSPSSLLRCPQVQFLLCVHISPAPEVRTRHGSDTPSPRKCVPCQCAPVDCINATSVSLRLRIFLVEGRYTCVCVQQEEHAGERMLLEAPPTAMVQSPVPCSLAWLIGRQQTLSPRVSVKDPVW